MAIVVTELTERDLTFLAGVIKSAQENGQSVKINQHSDGRIMVKRGGSTWTAPFGTDKTERPTATEYLAMEDNG